MPNLLCLRILDPMIERLEAYVSEQDDIELAILFGSIATGTERAESDLDVAVAAPGPLTPDRKKQILADLAEIAERAVDLVDLQMAPVPLLENIFETGRTLKRGDPAVYARLLRRLWNWNADMAENHRFVLSERRKRAFSPSTP